MQALVTKCIGERTFRPIWRCNLRRLIRTAAGVTAGIGVRHKYPDEFYTANGVFAYNAGLFSNADWEEIHAATRRILFQNDGNDPARVRSAGNRWLSR